jgi:heme-degrading monooxygenase HmoA
MPIYLQHWLMDEELIYGFVELEGHTLHRESLTLALSNGCQDACFDRRKRGEMIIARVWHGLTREGSADQYLQHLKKVRVQSYRNTQGCLGALVLRRVVTGVAEFLVISIWDSYEAIQRFTGPKDVNTAIYCQQDYAHLMFPEPKVVHYEIALLESTLLESAFLEPQKRGGMDGDGFGPESAD